MVKEGIKRGGGEKSLLVEVKLEKGGTRLGE